MSERIYRVVVTREAGAWLADLPELVGAHTYARTLPALDRAVREVAVLAEDLPDEAVDELRLAWEYHTGDHTLDEETARVRVQRAEAERLTTNVTASTAALARTLIDHGLPVRDAAVLLAVSPQRISQMTGHRHAS
jgi:predicted RNase H-like HicB family nuclease